MADAQLTAPPGLLPLYARAALGALLHRGGGSAATVAKDRLAVTDQPIDRDRLRRYQQLAGFRVSDVLPPTYLHLLAFPLSIARMTRSDFPFPLLGLVHVHNTISQVRPVTAEDRFDVTSWAQNVAPHPAGQTVDLLSEARIGDELVWSETSRYLRRGAKSKSAPEHADAPAGDGSDQNAGLARTQHPVAEQPAVPVSRWTVGADVSRRYAAVSGDRNPIHLHQLSARALGFKRAIAHGMWLEARTLAAFEGRIPGAAIIDVAFKTPTFLPSTVELTSARTADGWSFSVRNARSGKPHLTGTITS